jgi:potassium efflux system protein
VLLERQALLGEHDERLKELQELAHPRLSRERQAVAARSELERLQAQLAQPPQNFLPPVFLSSATEITKTALEEMKHAIETAQDDLNEWQAKFASGRAELAAAGSKQDALRTERDRLHPQVAALKAPHQERESATSAAKDPQLRLIAQERLTNAKLAARAAALRLKIVETKLAEELALVDVRELGQQVLEVHMQVSRKVLNQMQLRYREAAEQQQLALKQAAATQESMARQGEDPLEQYRARRRADILELEARVVKNEQSLAAGTDLTPQEQHALADRAEADFAEIKKLLDDGNVSRLDALRLTNDFRRIGPERERILRNELTGIETQLQYYENALTNVELELIEDSLAVQIEHDAVLERLAPQRHSQAQSDFAELERSYKAVLVRQKAILTKLVARASETLEQVTRRLRALDEEYGFIRTHIFWVRDQEPLGLATAQRLGRELKRLAKGLLTLAGESSDRGSWTHPSSEFLTAAAAAVILPLGLLRLRRLLRRRITRALPPSHLHGHQFKPVKVDMAHAIKRA